MTSEAEKMATHILELHTAYGSAAVITADEAATCARAYLESLRAREGWTDPAHLVDCVTPEGGLYSLDWYLEWSVGRDTATLDGKFSADNLRAIAAHMTSPPSTPEQ